MWRDGETVLLAALALCLIHVPEVGAMELLGQAGVLGEWELTGNLTGGGLGPVLDGVPCTYSARKTHAYEGTMSCAGRAPVPLLVWLK